MKDVEKKARLCHVIKDLSGYEVASPSGNTYRVTDLQEGAFGRCTCPWGEIHGETGMETGCSHMRAVWLYEQGVQLVKDAQDIYNDSIRAGYSPLDAAAAADSILGILPGFHDWE